MTTQPPYQLRVRDLIEALQREDQDAYVQVSVQVLGKDFETDPLVEVEHFFDDRRYVILAGPS